VISAMATDDAVSADDLALAGAAVASMHDELKVYPKPGLVSPVDSGAHADMDFDLMCRSADSLLQPFAALAAAGRQALSFDGSLAPLGVEAERQMLRATGGVNTHRGAIFSIGLVVAAIARARHAAMPVSAEVIQTVLRREWGSALEAHALGGEVASSHGALVRPFFIGAVPMPACSCAAPRRNSSPRVDAIARVGSTGLSGCTGRSSNAISRRVAAPTCWPRPCSWSAAPIARLNNTEQRRQPLAMAAVVPVAVDEEQHRVSDSRQR
jgi:hypothetical protein